MEKKKKMNKKAQVSIEVLAILAILVIGSIIFGVYYLSMSRKNIEIAARLDIGPDLYVENGPDDPGTDVPPEEPPPTPTGLLRIEATVDSGEALVYEDFNINVEITALPTGYTNNNVRVTKISPAKDDGGTQDCNYINTPIPSGGLEFAEGSQIFIGNAQNQSQSIGPIDCSSSGRYEFTITADMDFNAQENNYDPTNDKFIRDFNLSLFLVPPFPALVNTDFTINADVVSYLTNKNVVIKRIAIDTNNVCDYNGVALTTTGINTSYVMLPAGNNYNYNLNLFSCSVPGTYNFTIRAGELGSIDLNKNDTNTITKTITGSVIPDPFDLKLYLDPEGAAMIGTEFAIRTEVNNYLAIGEVLVNKISVELDGNPTDNCSIEGVPIPEEGKELNIIMQQDGANYSYLLEKLSCSVFGDYNFIISAKDDGDDGLEDTESIIKEIG
jgi:hypothetical protein